ncbi:carbohydrate kinase family protein [Planomicrobium sp. CPCC 101079]|uniref:carbohydrate kinase family protein n=1 Tax=Planomicrobium sp. CPCC 101079 TaxID=2599618 RepID=UPI0011B6017F|nr:carbohydrate kinase [Planomicrobium sp. CPCC 101079]TWT16017.1 carbohydrate kinase [Planomicrobium sp. CPCC 101079]
MTNSKHVLTYGDAFVDYIANNTNNDSFTRHLGGATVNVAAGVSRLGVPSAFITVTGDDETSEFVRGELEKENVILSPSIIVPDKRVSGVFIHLTPDYDRIFAEYVNETPDIQVTSEDLQIEAFEQASVFHICSGTMFHPQALKTTEKAVELAKANGVICSFDANIRPLRWDSEQRSRDTACKFLRTTDVLKVTTDELAFLMETDSMEEGITRLTEFNIPLVFLTDGKNGTFALFEGEVFHVPVIPVQPVDTTGAGDAFVAGTIRHIHLNGMPKTKQEVIECASFSNKLGALCATKAGALTAMPRIEELERLYR